MPNLAEQIREALSMFARTGTEPALIGGLAVAAHQVVRATQGVDLRVETEAAYNVHAALPDSELSEYFAPFNKSRHLRELP